MATFRLKHLWTLVCMTAGVALYFSEAFFEETKDLSPKELEERRAEQRYRRMGKKWQKEDIKATGRYLKMATPRGSHLDRYYSVRFQDYDGLERVQISDMDGEVVWKRSMDNFVPGPDENIWRKTRKGDYWCVYFRLPNMPNGTYELTVLDKRGNSFKKKVDLHR